MNKSSEKHDWTPHEVPINPNKDEFGHIKDMFVKASDLKEPTIEEKNRVLHKLVKPHLPEWHKLDEWWIAGEYLNCNTCDKTVMEHFEDNPNYFHRDLSDSLRVELIEQATKKFGAKLLYAHVLMESKIENYWEVFSIPSSVVAETIYRLCKKENIS